MLVKGCPNLLDIKKMGVQIAHLQIKLNPCKKLKGIVSKIQSMLNQITLLPKIFRPFCL